MLCFIYSSLVSVTIPASVEEIFKNSFKLCDRLLKVHLATDSRLRKIGNEAFSCCNDLRKIRFLKSLRVLDKHSFSFCIFEKDLELET